MLVFDETGLCDKGELKMSMLGERGLCKRRKIENLCVG